MASETQRDDSSIFKEVLVEVLHPNADIRAEYDKMIDHRNTLYPDSEFQIACDAESYTIQGCGMNDVRHSNLIYLKLLIRS